ncbi:MAG: GAF domain-containing protein [Caldilineae bacterium]|nr:MAG: GAF domain-containing protein [Caldilineae bacterium]
MMAKETLRILLVEDEISLRKPLADYLQRRNPYWVDGAGSAAEAWQLVEQAPHPYHVALIDDLLLPEPEAEPERIGIELMSRIKKHHPETECIIFTGWGMERAVDALRAGAYRYLQKPVSNEELELTIRMAAEYRRTRQERDLLSATLQISNAMLQKRDVSHILNQIAEAVCKLVGVESCAVAQYDPETDRITFNPMIPLGDEEIVWNRHYNDTLLTRHILETGAPVVVNDTDAIAEKVTAELRRAGVKSFAGMPLPGEVQNQAVLYAYSTRPGVFDMHAQRVLKLLAGQTAIALENARLLEQMQRHAELMEGLVSVVQDISAITDLHQRLETVWQFVHTRLRAPMFFVALYNPFQDLLHFEVAYDMERPIQSDDKILTDDPRKWGLAGYVVKTGQEIYWCDPRQKESALQTLPTRPHQVGEPCNSCLILPLRVRDKIVGVISMQSDKPRAWDTMERSVFRTLAGQVAVAIKNQQLFQEIECDLQRLNALQQASTYPLSAQNPQAVLQTIVTEGCKAVGGARACAILIDDAGRPLHLTSFGFENQLEFATSIRPNGISVQVARTGQPRFISNTAHVANEVHPKILEQGIQAAACLPLKFRERTAGVLWIHHTAPHYFSDSEKVALQIYADQAAIAYDKNRQMQELEHLRHAAEQLAGVADVQEVLQQIVRSARKVLDADSTVIWSYDSLRGTFLPDELTADGISQDLLNRFREDEPRPRGTAEAVMERGYLAVPDVQDPQYAFLGPVGHGLRGAIGAKAFQGITLAVGNEKLGVLYANYSRPRLFTPEDKITLQSFAHHAALTLKKARLLEQVRKARDTAGAVANVIGQEELDGTLQSIVRGIPEVLNCDSVTLHRYNAAKKRFEFPPAMWGVKYQEVILQAGPKDRMLVLEKMLAHGEMCVAENAPDDPIISGSFVKREGIQSAVGVPLTASGQTVGILFVNYCTRHRFTGDELENIKLFAGQAAIALRNAQLLEEARRKAQILEALYEAGKTITASLTLPEILEHIAEQAWRLTGYRNQPARFSHIAIIKEGDILDFEAAYPANQLPGLKQGIGCIHLKSDACIGITGRAVQTGCTQCIGDVRDDPDYLLHDPATRSELAVPIKTGQEVIGVINLEHPDLDFFDEVDRHALESLAAQAAVAIENARLFDKTKRRATQLEVASEVARHATAILDDVDRLLDDTVHRISDKFGFYHAGIFLLDESRRFAVFQAASSAGGAQMLKEGHKLKVGEEGIVGYVASTGKARIAPDVGTDAVHYANPHLPDTRSEMALPLKVRNRVIGVLDVQSDQPNTFGQADIATLQILADQLANAIENARLYRELKQTYTDLKQTKSLVASRTALALMGMANNVWRHSIENYALTIKEQVQLMHSDLQNLLPTPLPDRLQNRLATIERQVCKIQKKPLTPPLSSEEGVEPFSPNALVGERARQLWQNEPYQSAALQLNLRLPEDATVRASPEWLRRAFDILVENAVEAVASCPTRQITISTHMQDGGAAICIADTGPGIPEAIRNRIGVDWIEKPEDAKGLGMGLLMAHIIAQTYGGEIRVANTGPTGTTMVLWLPLEQKRGQTVS